MFKEGEVVSFLAKAGVQGALTGLASGAVFGFGRGFIRKGVRYNLVVYTALVGAVSSIVSDGVHKFVNEELHISRKAEDQMASFLGIAIASGVYLGSLLLVEPTSAEQMGYGKLLAIGGGAEYAAQFVNNLLL